MISNWRETSTLLKLPKVTKRWGGKNANTFRFIINCVGSLIIYIEKIIKSTLVLMLYNCKFIIIVSMLVIAGAQFVAFQFIMQYSRFYIFQLKH
ncbi:DUF5079 family protein [Staphylococcus aureus]